MRIRARAGSSFCAGSTAIGLTLDCAYPSDKPERTQGPLRMPLEVLDRAPDGLERHAGVEEPRRDA
jgi:hypothetical protein